ncbi:hypothetical protein SDC9_150802 [bioreactor metagenome]|uniref:Uncharacterized protein n=1 Tax=bioreactor metagenome TaxID=1076179 RepID=A0A645ENI8_9ZZZZ
MQEARMRLKYTVEGGRQADGCQVDHEKWKQSCTELYLWGIKIAEKPDQRLCIDVGDEHQRDEQQGLIGAQQTEQLHRTLLVIEGYEGGKCWDQGRVDRPFCEEFSEIIGDIEGEVDYICNRSGSEDGAEHTRLHDSEQAAEQGADHDDQAVFCRTLTFRRIVQGSPS